jgi:hypothetical protein
VSAATTAVSVRFGKATSPAAESFLTLIRLAEVAFVAAVFAAVAALFIGVARLVLSADWARLPELSPIVSAAASAITHGFDRRCAIVGPPSLSRRRTSSRRAANRQMTCRQLTN